MRGVLLVLMALFALTLQSTLLAELAPLQPDFMIGFVLYLSARYEMRAGSLLAFLLGYLEDIFLGSPIGMHSFALILLYLAMRQGKLRLSGFWSLFFLGFFAALGSTLLRALLQTIFIASVSFSGLFLSALALGALASAFTAPLVVWALQAIGGGGSRGDDARPLLRSNRL